MEISDDSLSAIHDVYIDEFAYLDQLSLKTKLNYLVEQANKRDF